MSVTIKSYRKERENEIFSGLQSAMERASVVVQNAAKKNIIAHSAKTPWKRTTQISSAVNHVVRVEGNQIIGEIGIPEDKKKKQGFSTAKVGKALELGHIQHPGQFVKAIGKRLVASAVPPYPWLFPAVEANRDRIKDILKGSKFTVEGV